MFTKSDLKSGMRVKYRNGYVRVVIGNRLVGNDGSSDLKHYTDELKEIDGYVDLDIVKVYSEKKDGNLKRYLTELCNPIWEESKRVRLTIKDIAKLVGCDSKDIEIID